MVSRSFGGVLTSHSTHWFWSEIYHQKQGYTWAAIAALFANIFAFLVSLFSMVVYDRILPNKATDSLVALLTGAGIVLSLDYLVRQIRGILLDRAGREIDINLNKKIFQQFVLRWKVSTGSSTGVNASIVRELDTIREFVASATIATFVDIPFAMLFLAMIFFLSGPLAIIPTVSIMLLLTIGYVTHKQNRPSANGAIESSRTKNALVIECLASREYVSSLPKVTYFSDRWTEAVKYQADQSDQTRHINNTSTNLVNLVVQLTQIAVISAGVIVESLTGVLVAATIMASRSVAPFSQVVQLLGRFAQTQQSFRGIGKLLESEGEVSVAGGLPGPLILAKNLDGRITFKNVSVAYPGQLDRPILKNITFEVSPGDRLAVLGRTGSGKTSLLRAMLGQIEISDGDILLGGISVRDIDKDSLMQRISFLPQDNYLFKASLLENVTLSRDDVTGEEVIQALKRTTLDHHLQSLPGGLKTDVGERGERLSGGQRRLLSMTRAVYRSHTHLLMDEPTSGLDPTSEKLLIQQFFSGHLSTTCIFTTHRPGPLAWANKILVLDSGSVKEFGEREEILKRLR